MTVGYEWTKFHFEEVGLSPITALGKRNNHLEPILWAVNHERLEFGSFSRYESQGGVDFVWIPPRTSFKSNCSGVELTNFRESLWYFSFCSDPSCLQIDALKELPFNWEKDRNFNRGTRLEDLHPSFWVDYGEIFQGKPGNGFVNELYDIICSKDSS